MGREVRRVPRDWQHPKDHNGHYKPLYPGELYEQRKTEFLAKLESDGLQEALEWCGNAPNLDDYMPNWPDEERTHYMMYEDTSEGTPISPAFETPEELARWLADTGASSFGSMVATYDQWLYICKGGWAPSAVMDAKGFRSGIEAAADMNNAQPSE